MRIEEGKFYRTRDGKKCGPMRVTSREGYTHWADVYIDGVREGSAIWRDGGAFIFPNVEDPMDLVAEWEDPAIPLIRQMREALQWMVDNDETNRGDEPMHDKCGQTWDEINAYWVEGLERAEAAIAAADEFLKA